MDKLNARIRTAACRFAERSKYPEEKRARMAAVDHLLDWAGSTISISKITDPEFARYKIALGVECTPNRLQLLRKLFTCLNKNNLLSSAAWKALELDKSAESVFEGSSTADSPISSGASGGQSIISNDDNGRVIRVNLPLGSRVTFVPQGLRIEYRAFAVAQQARPRDPGDVPPLAGSEERGTLQ
jgi:hypothetical protein